MNRPGAHASVVITAAAAVLGALVSARMLVTYETLPGWSSDPTLADIALGTSIGPSLRLGMNAAMLAVAGVVLGHGWLTRHGKDRPAVQALMAILLAAGMGMIASHLGLNTDGSVEDWIAASDLAAAFAVCAAASALRHGERAHRVLGGVIVGAVVLVAAKGMLQFFVEHDQTVRAFRAARDQILASNGWESGSASALAYERRLMQREATGWFGLSNVFASVVGAGAVALAGLGLSARDRSQRRVLWSAAALAGVGVVLSASKGGIVATAIGAAILGALWVIRGRPDRRGRNPRLTVTAVALVPVAMVIAGQAAIAARGVIGERIGELSLLFRWFYVRGAARIFGENALTGVGPAGFKDAYMVAKAPIAPEDVASPHSLPWDLVATLGLGGAALAGVWLAWLGLAGRSAARAACGGMEADGAAVDPAGAMIERRIVAAACAAAGIGSVWVERTATAPETAMMKLAGLGAWMVVSVAAAQALRRPTAVLGLAAAACGLAIHSQIEMTAVWPGSGAWYMAMIGLSAASVASDREAPASGPRADGTTGRLAFATAAPALAALIAVAACCLFTITRAATTRGWEALLERAAERAVRVTRMQARMEEAGRAIDGARRAGLVDAICSEFGVPPPAGPDLGAWSEELVLACAAVEWPAALADLLVASSITPGYEPLREATSRLALRIAEVPGIGDPGRYSRVAVEEAEGAAAAARRRVSGLAWHATVMLLLVERGALNAEEGLAKARASLVRAAEIDPYNFQHAARLAMLEERAGRLDDAAAWASRAIELEKFSRLDPLKRMDDRTRSAVQRLAAPAGG